MKENQNLPVAFATNAFYVMARNGMLQGSGTLVQDHIIPLIHEKKQWIHAEGVALTVHALSAAKLYDPEIWNVLKEKIAEKDFDYEVVKSARIDPSKYVKQQANEHFFQADYNQLG